MTAKEYHVYILFAGPFGYDDSERVIGVYQSLAGAQSGLEERTLKEHEWWHSTESPENWNAIDRQLPESEQMLPYRIQRYKAMK